MTESQRRHRFQVILAFALVYVFWGSTYLAIGIADDEHIPAAAICAMRFLTAGPLMLAACALMGRKIRVSWNEFFRLAIVGTLLLVCGNTVLAWAEKYVATGFASLIVAITPIWNFCLESFVYKGEKTSGRGVVGLALGVIGLFVLFWPKLVNPDIHGGMQLMGACSLLGSSFCWANGSVLSRRWKSNFTLDPITATAYEMIVAGLVNLVISVAFHERGIRWTPRALGAIFYLVIFGSWVGFTAYIWLLKHVPTPKVATYAYVNPIVAVFLGWFVHNESIDRYIAAGSLIIVAAVALVTRAEIKSSSKPLKLSPASELRDTVSRETKGF
jgi:drug/metabolite transporter (DMT)-like permease